MESLSDALQSEDKSRSPARGGVPVWLWELVALLLVSMQLRLPFFFRDVIDWDESVFIVMAQSLADGHLPYTEVWDNKPPLGFALLAIVQFLFPQSLLAVRLFGAIMVGLGGFLTSQIARSVMPQQAALLAGLFYCFAATLLAGSGQAVMMEHLANPFLLLALLLVMTPRPGTRDIFLFGVFLALAILVRTNLAYAAVVGGSALVLSRLPEGMVPAIRTMAWGAFGGLLVLLLCLLPFLVSGTFGLFLTSVVTVPMAYAAYGPGYLEAAGQLLRPVLPDGLNDLLSVRQVSVLLFWIGGALGLAVLIAGLRLRKGSYASWAIVIGTLAVALATLATRQAYGHYLIQVIPFFAIGAAYLLWWSGLASAWRLIPVYAVVAVASVAMLVAPYRVLVDRFASGKTLYSGQNFALASYLLPRLAPEDRIFTSRHILLYWLMDRPPVVPIAAFPSNIFREKQIVKPLYGEDYTSEKLLNDILDQRPAMLILSINDKNYAEVESFARRVDTDYFELTRSRDIFILKRRNP